MHSYSLFTAQDFTAKIADLQGLDPSGAHYLSYVND